MLFNETDRGLLWRIWSLAWPMVVYNMLEMTVGLVDLVMVRSFGPSATAAIGLSRQVTFLVEAAVLAISTGVITLVSQAVGARRSDQIKNVVRQSTLLIVLLGLPTTLVGYFLSGPILVWLGASGATFAHGAPYLRIYFTGLALSWGSFVGAAVFRGLGDARTPLKVALGVSLLNIVLNYLFIFGAGPLPGFQVSGAAMATVAVRGCAAIVYLGLLWHGAGHARLQFAAAATVTGAHPWALDWTLIARILRIGVPMALAGVLRSGSRLVFLAIISASNFGYSLHAAVGVGLLLRNASILPALAFQVSTATLVGQAIGRGNYAEAELLGRRSVQLLALLMVLVVSTIILLAGPLASLFIASPEVARLGTTVLRWFAVAQFFSAVSIGTQGALMGAGDTAPNMRYTLLGQWVVMLPTAYVLLNLADWDPGGPLLAWTLAPLVSLSLVQWRFRTGRWKQVKA